MTYVTSFLADEYHITSNKNLVNFPDLNRILRFEPIFKHFKSPKNVIKAKEKQLALIDVAVLDFLLIDPPPPRTQDAQLPAPLVTKLLYSHVQPIPLDDEDTECTLEPTQEVTNKDFEVFYHQEGPEDSPRPS